MGKNVVYDIVINDKGSVTLNNIAGGSQKAKAGLQELEGGLNTLKSTILEFAGIYEGIQFFSSSESYYLGIKRANAEIEASLKSTGEAAGVTRDQLTESSEALYNNTTYNKEQIKQMQAMVLTFPKITKSNFNEAEQAIVDMAAKFKETDLQGFAVRVGKALQDPATGMMMLRREGVNFTKEQTKMVKAMVDAGHLGQAQTYIMHELAVEFAGSAKAAYDAGGAHEKLGKGLEDIKEEAGRLVAELETDLVPVLEELMGGFKKTIEWGERHKELLEGIAKAVVVLVGGYVAYRTVVGTLAAVDFLFGTSLAELTGGLGILTTATEAETVAMTALDAAMDANPIGIIVTALGGLAIALDLASEKADTLHYKLNHLQDNDRASKSILGKFQGETDDDDKSKSQKQDEDMSTVLQQIKNEKGEITHAQEQAKQWGDPEGAYDKIIKEESARLSRLSDIYSEMQYEVHPELNPDWKNNPAHIAFMGNGMPVNKDDKKKDGSGAASTDVKTPDMNDLKGEKHTIITFNIKDFNGVKEMVVVGDKEAGTAAGENIFRQILAALNDAQTTADIN